MLIVGLGNPGKKYENTRHNVGHMVIDQLEQKNLDGFILAKTDTFMNESGRSVKKIIENWKATLRGVPVGSRKIENLIVVHDDIDLPIGIFKIQKSRGAAGHKGVQSIIDEFDTKDFWRIRIGICPKEGKPQNVEKFVLQKFTKEEKEIVKDVMRSVLVTIKRPGLLSPQPS